MGRWEGGVMLYMDMSRYIGDTFHRIIPSFRNGTLKGRTLEWDQRFWKCCAPKVPRRLNPYETVHYENCESEKEFGPQDVIGEALYQRTPINTTSAHCSE